jgi:hypothetical protein
MSSQKSIGTIFAISIVGQRTGGALEHCAALITRIAVTFFAFVEIEIRPKA